MAKKPLHWGPGTTIKHMVEGLIDALSAKGALSPADVIAASDKRVAADAERPKRRTAAEAALAQSQPRSRRKKR